MIYYEDNNKLISLFLSTLISNHTQLLLYTRGMWEATSTAT